MPEFKKQRFGNTGRPFSKSRFGSRDGGQERGEMYDAECDRCHDRCQVPFRPNGKKPVYCRNCYGQGAPARTPRFDAPSGTQGRSESRVQPDPRIDDLKRDLAKVHATLEKLVAAVESSNRATELKSTVRRLVPAKPANAPVKDPAAKKAVKKKTVKKAKKA